MPPLSARRGEVNTQVTETIPCHKPGCSVTFHDIDVREFHFARTHHAYRNVLPRPIVNEALDASLQNFIDTKRSFFKTPPRLPEPETAIVLQCTEPGCFKTFENKATREFHFNRMHHSRHPSLLSQLTDKSDVEHEKRRQGYWCIEAECRARFLSEELRDFHCMRVHPMLWKATQDMAIAKSNYKDMTAGVDVDRVADGDKIQQAETAMATDSRSSGTAPQSETGISENSEVSEISAMTKASQPESDTSEIISSSEPEEDKQTKEARSPTPWSLERTSFANNDGIVTEYVEDIGVMNGDVEILLTSAKSEPLADLEETKPAHRPRAQYRSRSQMMMDRNALANPGASEWVVRN